MPNQQPDQLNKLQVFYGVRELHKHWVLLLSLGILLIILGLIAISYSTITTFASVVFLGVIILAAGIVQAVQAFWARRGEGFWFTLIAGILYTVVGALLISRPAAAALTLTLILAAFFIVSGLIKIVGSIVSRFDQWGWVLLSGIISLLLGAMIWSEWPESSLWVIGLFVGIDLLFIGWFWVALSLSVNHLSKKNLNIK